MGYFESFIGINIWTALFVLLNFLLLFFVAKKFLFKPVKDMIDSRQKEIDEMYAQAENAKANAERNGVQNAEFICADAGEFMRDMASAGEKADVVFMDPPRAGSDKRFLSSVVTLNPERVVYISCNPETLERDLRYLVNNGYEVKKMRPVDMFPFTLHCEMVVQLAKQNK